MKFNVSEYKILQVYTHYAKSFFYQMYGVPLEIFEQHNYLGVCLYHRFSCQPHIDSICNKDGGIVKQKDNYLFGFLHINLDIALVN